MREYFVKNYWVASYLKMMSVESKKIEITKHGKRSWVYDDSSELRELIKKLYEDEMLQAFVKSCIEMKRVMYDKKKTA